MKTERIRNRMIRSMYLFILVQVLAVVDLFAGPTSGPIVNGNPGCIMIEQGNHRCISVVFAAVSGKVGPNDIVGFLDGMPVTAAEIVPLYRSGSLVSGQGGYHIKVEEMADNFCLNKLNEGPPLTLTSKFDPSNAVCPLNKSVSYERLDPQRFGWFRPANATVDELLTSRCPDYGSKLDSFCKTSSTPHQQIDDPLHPRPRGPEIDTPSPRWRGSVRARCVAPGLVDTCFMELTRQAANGDADSIEILNVVDTCTRPIVEPVANCWTTTKDSAHRTARCGWKKSDPVLGRLSCYSNWALGGVMEGIESVPPRFGNLCQAVYNSCWNMSHGTYPGMYGPNPGYR